MDEMDLMGMPVISGIGDSKNGIMALCKASTRPSRALITRRSCKVEGAKEGVARGGKARNQDFMKREAVNSTMLGLLLAGLFFLGASCAVNPVTGGPQLMLVSEEDERKIGRETDLQVNREYGTYRDPELTAYLDSIYQPLGKLSHRPHLAYQFKVLDVSVVNAFAVPGGYVYFTRGILASLNSEAELAAVMGHEIGHITARHSAQQMSRAQLAQIGLMAGSVLSETFRTLSDAVGFGIGMLFLSFSRENEREADDLAVEYASKAGYDASQMAHFFESLQKMHPESDKTGLPSWFSTHPSPEEREKTVRERAAEWQKRLGLKEPKINRAPYLKKIDGLVYGEDPRQGFVHQGVFYHPELRFQFPVPAQWKVNNAASKVQMVSKEGEAAILFSFAPGRSPAEAAKSFASENQASILQSGAVDVNGLSSYRLVSDIRTQKATYRVHSYFIQKDQRLYVFHGLTTPTLFAKYDQTFEKTMRQFNHLSDPKKLKVKPTRIRVKSTIRTESMEASLRSLGIPIEECEEVALLNGIDLKDMVPANTLIKVIEKGDTFPQ